MRFLRATAALLVLSSAAAHALPVKGEIVTPNDNRRPAGRLADGVLTIELEARRGAWYPEGPGGRGIEVAAWSEPGKPLLNPGPLVRVPLGTRVRATLRNTLEQPLRVAGLSAARGPQDSVVLAPGESREVAFTADAAGTFYYAGTLLGKPSGVPRTGESQLHGAIVVDSPNARSSVRVGNDRVFLISWYFTFDSTSRTGLGHGTMAINGLSWPHTERVELLQGDSVRWRVVNLTPIDHPMHLHGFYFRVDAKGDGARDSVYAPADRRMAVTEVIEPLQTMTLAWAPQRPGNWVFHCHYHSHISNLSSLGGEHATPASHAAMGHGDSTSGATPHQMFGLVLGISVAPSPGLVAARRPARAERPVRILVRQQPNVYGERPGFAFVLGGSADDASGALPIPARPLALTKGEPVAITIVNRAESPTTIHWHGIELESYPDGVPGWSGQGTHVMPSIRPGDSLTVRFTPPRAGTFMYHSHFDEFQQISSGLYGPILVLEPGDRYDPETDRVFFVSKAGITDNVIRGPFAPLLLNGSERPAPLQLRARVPYRFRFLNLSDDFPAVITLKDGDRPATWRALAKDGATLPPNQATDRPAVLVFDPGETYDFTFSPQRSGALSLSFGHVQFPGGPKFTPVTVPVQVHAPF